MASVKQTVRAGNRTLQVSNLEKILYPDAGITKAEVIQYYLLVAPYFLRYSKYRPLSLVRFPDGIEGERFYQKDLPSWRPDWITSFRKGRDRAKDYITVTEEATLVWLANLACLELHQMHFRTGNAGNPDYIVFDLDPPEGFPFEDLKDIAISLRTHLEQLGYRVYLKTSGSKGLHLFAPVTPEYSVEECFLAAKEIAEKFTSRTRNATLALRKESRKNRVFIDVLRNRESQTIVSPYSLRGTSGAPVSMPVSWDFLEELKSSDHFKMNDAQEWLENQPDPWEGMDAYAIHLHTHAPSTIPAANPPGNKHKSAVQLAEYMRKRDFSRTTEPGQGGARSGGNDFVVHRHDASHLHYDLRLEENGVLRSWAVPKGMPARPGEKRLAVETEDHPLEYLTFEGDIPKGEYGGGRMLIAAAGKYSVTKKKKDGFYFSMASKTLSGEYRIHRIKEKEWLLERVDSPVPDYLNSFTPPMLAEQKNSIPAGEDLRYELKWDGIRAMVQFNEGQVTLFSRSGIDMTEQFPELTSPEFFRGKNGLFDGEIVCPDEDGKPDFKKVMKRFQASGQDKIARLRKSGPAFLYLFDVLYADGLPLVNMPLFHRRMILDSSLKTRTGYIRLSEVLEDGQELFDAASQMGLEGIMCKDMMSVYVPGKRTSNWIKVKVRHTAEVSIIGFTRGKGSLENSLGALHLAEKSDGTWSYRGKVGTGFTDRKRKELFKRLAENKEIKNPVAEVPGEQLADAIWIAKPLKASVSYASINPGGVFREPVFNKLVK